MLQAIGGGPGGIASRGEDGPGGTALSAAAGGPAALGGGDGVGAATLSAGALGEATTRGELSVSRTLGAGSVPAAAHATTSDAGSERCQRAANTREDRTTSCAGARQSGVSPVPGIARRSEMTRW